VGVGEAASWLATLPAMATRATFDMSGAESMGAVKTALDDLHEVTWREELSPGGGSTVAVSMQETPLWAFPLAAAVVIGPWLTASLAGWARFSIAGDDGLRLSTDFEGTQATLLAVGAVVALVVSLFIGWWLVTKFKRPTEQGTIAATPNDDDTATDLVMSGSPDRYIHLAVRRVFDTHDREAIARREADGDISLTDILGFGGGAGGGRTGLFGQPVGQRPGPEDAPTVAPDQDPQDPN